MPDPAAPPPPAGKNRTRNIVIIGGIGLAIGIGFVLWRNQQAGTGSTATDTAGGAAAGGYTNMRDIIQTVQGPPGPAGPRGPGGKDDDDKKKKKKKAA